MRRFLFFAAAIAFLSSCSSVAKESPCLPDPRAVLFRFVSASGADLLDTSNPGAYDSTQIKMSSIDLPVIYKVFTGANIGLDSFFIYSIVYYNWQNAPEYYLRFPDGDIDTIATTQKEANTTCFEFDLVSLKYNGVVLNPGILVNTARGPVSGYTIVK